MNARANTTIDANQFLEPTKWGSGNAKFGALPIIDNHLFQVNPEIPVDYLLDHAQCMAQSVRDTLLNTDDSIDGNQVWMLWNSMDQLVALLNAIEIANKKTGG